MNLMATTKSMLPSSTQGLRSAVGLVLLAGGLLGTTSCGGFSSGGLTASPARIKHVIIIFQENRTPDNLFQDPVLIARGADIAGSGINSKGETIPLTPINLGTVGETPDLYDLDHSHNGFLTTCHLNLMTGRCAMDNADRVHVGCGNAFPGCLPINPQFKYVDPADVQPYFQMAEQYTFGDRMFQTNQGPSFPAHQFIISGTSAPAPGSNWFVDNNPAGVPDPGDFTGCTADPAELVEMIDPQGVKTDVYPCFDHSTLTDLLNQANISWRYYTPSAGSIWTAPNAIKHMCGPNAEPPHATECTGPDWVKNVILPTSENPAPVLRDIAAGKLPAVSWVMPTGSASDHALTNDGSGPSWVASVVNAIGNSQYWADTAIFVTWDDWGGWYDHVAPPLKNSYEYGLRVPLIVISPYAKAGYISHDTHDFGSILKFVEGNFNLPSLGYADADADDLSDCFDLTQQALTFKTIQAPLKADYFLNDRRPPTDPDDD
jgi:phospholipase C